MPAIARVGDPVTSGPITVLTSDGSTNPIPVTVTATIQEGSSSCEVNGLGVARKGDKGDGASVVVTHPTTSVTMTIPLEFEIIEGSAGVEADDKEVARAGDRVRFYVASTSPQPGTVSPNESGFITEGSQDTEN